MATGGSQQQWLPSISVTGFNNLGNFDKFSGGNVTSSPTKYRPGGMGNEVTYEALPTFSDVMVSRVYEEDRDHVLIGQLHNIVGQRYGTVSLQPLDDTGHRYGTPRTYYGRVVAVDDGTTDSESNAVRSWSISISVETIAN